RRLGVLFVKWQKRNGSGKECCEALAIGFRLRTFGNPVPEFKSHDGRNKHLVPRSDGGSKSAADGGRLAIDQRDAGVGIEQIVHGKSSRRGVLGWFRSLIMNGSSAHRSKSSNHFAVSVTKGSRSTPPETFRTRTRSPSKR